MPPKLEKHRNLPVNVSVRNIKGVEIILQTLRLMIPAFAAFLTIMWVNPAHTISRQNICTIKGICTVKDALLKQRPGKKGLGERVFINKETSEVTGYFGTDGAKIIKVKRPASVLV